MIIDAGDTILIGTNITLGDFLRFGNGKNRIQYQPSPTEVVVREVQAAMSGGESVVNIREGLSNSDYFLNRQDGERGA